MSPILQLGLTNFWRHKWLSLATIMVIAIILFMFNIITAVKMLANYSIAILNTKVDIIIYLKPDSDKLTVSNLLNQLKALPEVKEVIYTSKEEALQTLLKNYQQEDPFQKYGLENKLPANIRIATFQPADQAKVMSFLKTNQYNRLFQNASSHQENKNIVEQLIHVTDLTQKILWGIILIYLISGFLIIQNSIKLALYNRRQEIQIMQIMGANYQFIYLPFMIEGLLYSLLGVSLNLLGFFLFMAIIKPTQFGLNLSQESFRQLIIWEIIFSLTLGLISSFLTVKRYLKDKILNFV